MKYFLLFIPIFIICLACDSNSDIANTECSVSGLLRYGGVSDGWEIRETVPNAIDNVNIYLIKEYVIDLPKNSTVNVQATGLCSPSAEKVVVPAGTTLYDLVVNSLIFN